MAYSNEQLNQIYDRSSGCCHLCHKKLAFKNYGIVGARGAWEVEHSKPRANGGTNHRNNLYAACVQCNRSKGASSTRSVRAANGKTRAPLSVQKRKEAKQGNALVGGTAGAVLGDVIFGPLGALGGAVLGAHLGRKKNPDKK